MRKFPLLLVCAAAACSPPPHRTGDEGELKTPLAGKLAGHEVERAGEGVWMVRRTVRLARESEGSTVDRAIEAGTADMAPAGAPAPAMRREHELGAAMLTSAAPDDSAVAESAADKSTVAAPEPEADSAAVSPTLRAGSTDDNAEFAAFLEFVGSRTDGWQDAARYDLLDVRARKMVRVVTAGGSPLPAAEVRVVDVEKDTVVLRGTTHGDGRTPFYPTGEAQRSYLVEVRHGEQHTRMDWNGDGDELVVEIDAAGTGDEPVRLDVAFVIDTTGSMGDEIARIKSSLLAVTDKLRSLEREFELRYGAVLYRDVGDDYVTKMHPFTTDLEAFDKALKAVQAGGGGDGPESLNQGLAVAVNELDWRPGAARVAFLIADAPPHMDYDGDVGYGTTTRRAVADGIRVHAVAASGLDALGTLVFRQIAQFTRGKFIFIEYGGTQASAASHGVTGAVKSNNLDDILFEQIRDEVAQWGR